MKGWMRRVIYSIILFFIVAFVCLAALEGVSTYVLRNRYGVTRENAMHILLAKLQEVPSSDESLLSPGDAQINHERDLHPFFGYTGKRNAKGFNNFGFTTWQKFPYRKAPDEFVIGTFGGSFAQQFIDDNEAVRILNQEIFPAIERLGYTRITHINLSESAWRQPQNHYALLHYLSDIDLAITIDGFNEIANIDSSLAINYPIDFPNSGIWLGLVKNSLDVSRVKKIHEILEKNEAVHAYAALLNKEPFRISLFCHLLWHLHFNKSIKEVAALREKLQTDAHWENFDTTPEAEAEKTAAVERYFQSYENWIRNAQLLARARGKRSIHFIQPNQYVAGTKELSEEEKEHYTTNEKLRSEVNGYYPRLEEMVTALQSEKFPVYSLTNVFQSTQATVYRDDCCHISSLGNEIVARAVAKHLLGSGVLVVPPLQMGE